MADFKELTFFDPTNLIGEDKKGEFGVINLNALPSAYRAGKYLNDSFIYKAVKSAKGGLVKRLTRVFSGRFNGDNGKDGEFICPSSARAFVYSIPYQDRTIEFIYCSLAIYCHRRDLEIIAGAIPRIAAQNRPAADKTSNKDLLHSLNDMLSSLYNNESIIRELYSQLAPYVSTFALRKKFGINMNLSVVLSGMPGDGKTFAGTQIAKWMNKHLDLPIAEGSHLTFEKASKLADHFVGLIDDMTIGHFQRQGPYAEYCECMLSEMDKTGTNRLFLLTTNEVITRDNVDAAFFRPGRIQGIINFHRPNRDVKERFWSDLRRLLLREGLAISDDQFTGLNMLFEANDFSLAQLFRAKNLIITDLVLKGALENPLQSYIERSSPINVAQNKEEAEQRFNQEMLDDEDDFEDFEDEDEDDF